MVTVFPLQCRLYNNNLAQYLAYLFCLRNTILIRLILLSAYTLVEKATNVNNLICKETTGLCLLYVTLIVYTCSIILMTR